MYESKVLGVKYVKFTNEQTGELIEGRQVWLHMETPDPAWNGWEVFKVWAAAGTELFALAGSLRVDDIVRLSLSRTGKVCGMSLA